MVMYFTLSIYSPSVLFSECYYLCLWVSTLGCTKILSLSQILCTDLQINLFLFWLRCMRRVHLRHLNSATVCLWV